MGKLVAKMVPSVLLAVKTSVSQLLRCLGTTCVSEEQERVDCDLL